MKLKLLTLLVGAAIVAPSAMADVTVYGKLNASVESTEKLDGDTGDVERAFEVKSNSSRFGVKGSAELTDSLQAIYKLEWGVDISDKSKSSEDHITSRNQYVGLKGGFGQVIVGRHDTPLKSSQGNVDLFGDLGGDLANIMPGDNRTSNTILYSTPKLGDMVTVNAAIMPGEDHGGDNDGIADSFSASVVLETGPFYAALAYDDEVKSTPFNSLGGLTDAIGLGDAKIAMDTIRGTFQYNADVFGVGVLLQKAEPSEDSDSDVTSGLLSGYFKVGEGQIEAQIARSQYDIASDVVNVPDDLDVTQFTLGYEHKLGKKTNAFVYVTRQDVDVDSADEDVTNFGLGLEHSF